MFERRRFKCIVALMLCVFISGVFFLAYLCPERVCASNTVSQTLSDHPPAQSERSVASFPHRDLEREYRFDVEGDRDVLVFLHIQKTGGTTFGRHLVRNADITNPCVCYKDRKRCDCENSKKHIWLFSRYSTGWVCGLHADWTELHDCVPKALDEREEESRDRRYLYFTILREPIQRYISEWKHVQRGSTWLSAKLMCNGRQATLDEVPFCFRGSDWTGVGLNEFLSCPHNLAHNRQTRMLANLSLIGCYNQSAVASRAQREQAMLDSAKDNLRSMAFFGLTEYQAESRFLFEHTFRLHFTKDFVQYTETHASKAEVSEAEQRELHRLNRLDLELYAFAKDLFFARLQYARGLDNHSEQYPRRKGNDAAADPANYDPSAHVQYEETDETYEGEVEEEEHEAARHKERVARAERSRRRRNYAR